MRRHGFSFRERTYNQMPEANTLLPVFRRFVNAGQSMEIGGKLHFQTPEMPAVMMNSAVMSAYFFYVPIRLIWDQWVDFIIGDGNISQPAISTPQSWLFEQAGDLPFYRQAYKLVWNQYFSWDQLGSPVAQQTMDNFVIGGSPLAVLGLQDFHRKFIGQAQGRGESQSATDNAYMADLVGPGPDNAVIDYNEFAAGMSRARALFNRSLSGNKYVDFLAALGVGADWLVQEAPELLWSGQIDVEPTYTSVTANEDTGRPSTRYICKLPVDIKRKSFAEHGVIIGCCTFRPVEFFVGQRAIDRGLQAGANRWWRNAGERQLLQQSTFGYDDGDAPLVEVGSGFVTDTGQHLLGRVAGGGYVLAKPIGSRNMFEAAFGATQINTGDALGGDTGAVYGDFRVRGQSPAPDAPVFGV